MRRGAKELEQSSTKIQVTSNVTITEKNEGPMRHFQIKLPVILMVLLTNQQVNVLFRM